MAEAEKCCASCQKSEVQQASLGCDWRNRSSLRGVHYRTTELEGVWARKAASDPWLFPSCSGGRGQPWAPRQALWPSRCVTEWSLSLAEALPLHLQSRSVALAHRRSAP